MRKLLVLAIGASLGAMALAGCSSGAESSSGAQQDNSFENYFDNGEGGNAISLITGGYPDQTYTCSGDFGFNPVFITNTTSAPQTFSVTGNSTLANIVSVGTMSDITSQIQSEVAGEGTCPAGGNAENAYTQTVTVPAGQTYAGAIFAGGHGGPHSSPSGQQHNLSIGAGGKQWYDLWIHLTAGGGFENWELNYSNTGGTNPSQNLQPGLFNGVQCTVTSNGGNPAVPTSVTMSTNLTTPYSSNAPNAWTFNKNHPICFSFQ